MNYALILFWAVFAIAESDTEHKQKISFTDARDAQSYEAVRIGSLYWMTSNLNFHTEGSVPALSEKEIKEDWGRLYPATEYHSVCPEGWRLPTTQDWPELKAMMDELGVEAFMDGSEWEQHKWASNSTGLSLVPAGFKHKRHYLHQHVNCSLWFDNLPSEGGEELWHFHMDGTNNLEPYYFHSHAEEVYKRYFAIRCVCEIEDWKPQSPK